MTKILTLFAALALSACDEAAEEETPIEDPATSQLVPTKIKKFGLTIDFPQWADGVKIEDGNQMVTVGLAGSAGVLGFPQIKIYLLGPDSKWDSYESTLDGRVKQIEEGPSFTGPLTNISKEELENGWAITTVNEKKDGEKTLITSQVEVRLHIDGTDYKCAATLAGPDKEALQARALEVCKSLRQKKK